MKLRRISTKFILSFVCILATVFAVLILAFEVGFRLIMDDYIKRNSFSMQDEIDASVTEVINESAYLYGRIMLSSNVALLNDVANGGKTREERESAYSVLMNRIGINDDYFNDVMLLCDDVRFSARNSVYYGYDELKILQEKRDALIYLGNTDDSLVIGINSSNWTSNASGIFLFFMSADKVNDMCNPASGGEGYSFIMRSDGYVVSHPDKSLNGKVIVYSDVYNPAKAPEYKKQTLEGKRRIIATGQSNTLNSRYGFDCCIVSVLDYKYYFGDMDIVLGVVTGVSVAMLIVSVALAVVRAKKISKPITLLSDSINATAEPTGRPLPSVLEEGDELKQLEKNYDDMMKRIFDLVERNKEEMQRQRKLELDSLQMQINPHFLYNTLDAISWMARIKKQPEINTLVMNLAKFFRLFLHNGDKFVTVADEVQMVLSYLEIDRIRYPDRVVVHADIADDVAELKVLKLVLQPITENCLKYAFVEHNGNIYIRAFAQGEDIIFEVEDDGNGFDVPNDLFTRKSHKEGGYGLKNVHERIRLQYGENYGLSVKSAKGKGTVVTARLRQIDAQTEQ